MSEQRHIIKRQVIELTIQNSTDAQSIQSEMSRVYRQRIIPLIEQRFSEISGPDRLYRLDALELDLGVLNMTSFEEDFVAKMDMALNRQLGAQILEQESVAGKTGSNSRAQSQLELFVFFVRTGNLPWWTDTSNSTLLNENLEHLLRESPEALSHVLLELARESYIRQRMIHHYSNQQLAALCGLLVPEYAAALQQDLQALLQGLKVSQAERLRQSLWSNSLLVACAGGQYVSLDAFYQAIFTRVAAEFDIKLMAGIYRSLQADAGLAHTQFARVIARLAGINSKPQTPSDMAETARLEHLQAGSRAFDEALAILQNLSPRVQAELQSILNQLPVNASAQTIAQSILQALQTRSAWQSELSAKLPDVIRLLGEVSGNVNTTQKSAAQKVDKKPVDLSYSEADDIQVANSGLVILWPFLGHFFTHLGLLGTDRHFKDPADRQRAAGLLQMIATQDPTPPEYQLPLNKLLCGLDVNDVFDFGAPILESETQECADLLQAVIAQAPILHDMSTDGFRGSFLLRPGILSVRDGMWLLRVERQTYDIVLDRFPWNWEWVRLSWMEAPLRVEW